MECMVKPSSYWDVVSRCATPVQLREVGGMISEKKKGLPAAGEDGTRPASPLDAEIKELEEVRPMLPITSTQSTTRQAS